MEADKSFFKESQQLIEEYIRERLLLLKFQTAERTAGIISTLVVGLILGLLAFMILFFISIMGIYFCIQLTGNWYYGLLIMILLYTLVLFIVYKQRIRLNSFFTDNIVGLFFSESSNPLDEEAGK